MQSAILDKSTSHGSDFSIREAATPEIADVNMIRKPLYGSAPINVDKRIKWYVAVNKTRVVACVGLLEHEGVMWVVDMAGRKGAAWAWEKLADFVIHLANERGIPLACWVKIDNKNLKYMERMGLVPQATLLRKEPE